MSGPTVMSRELLVHLMQILLLRVGGQATITVEEMAAANMEYAGTRFVVNENRDITLTLRTRNAEGEVV